MTEPNAHIDYSFADIERYLNGSMTAREMHALEKAALQDPFLADAIEGYTKADMTTAAKHLNEVAAALHKEMPAKVIPLPNKKRYGWLVAASLLAVLGTGILLLSKENNLSKPLAANQAETAQPIDSSGSRYKVTVPGPDTESSVVSDNLALTKPEQKDTRRRITSSPKNTPSPSVEAAAEPAYDKEEAPQRAMAYTKPQESSNEVLKQTQSAPALPSDTIRSNGVLSEVAVSRRKNQLAANTEGWTTDKGKPFRLSEVEVINIGRKQGKKSDTLSVKPQGGWSAFHDYLFSRLSRNDSLLLVNDNKVSDNLELEFSLDESGSPYNVEVHHAKDSVLSNKIINAIQSGPKWTSGNTDEKRLRLKY